MKKLMILSICVILSLVGVLPLTASGLSQDISLTTPPPVVEKPTPETTSALRSREESRVTLEGALPVGDVKAESTTPSFSTAGLTTIMSENFEGPSLQASGSL